MQHNAFFELSDNSLSISLPTVQVRQSGLAAQESSCAAVHRRPRSIPAAGQFRHGNRTSSGSPGPGHCLFPRNAQPGWKAFRQPSR